MRSLLFTTVCVTLMGGSSPRIETVSTTDMNEVIDQSASDTLESGRSEKVWAGAKKVRNEPSKKKKKTRIV